MYGRRHLRFHFVKCFIVLHQQFYKVVPIKDIRNLYVTFPIPDLQKYYKSNPGHYLGHLIGHEGPGSLLSELKSKGQTHMSFTKRVGLGFRMVMSSLA